MINNKIKIPWYRKNVSLPNGEDTVSQPIDFNNITFPKPNITPRPKPQPRALPEPVRNPVRVPADVPVLNPNPSPFPTKFPIPDNPLDKFPIPFPDNPFDKKFPLPIPIPPPKDNKPTVPNGIPRPAPTFFEKFAGTMLKPVIYFFAAKELSNQYIKANVTDPVYNKMLQDPVLGFALREAEKSNLDMEQVANYFANYDYDNFNAEEMTKELTLMFGAATAARLIVYFIGRKVVLRF